MRVLAAGCIALLPIVCFAQKSVGDCEAEMAAVPAEERQAAVVDCLVKAASPSKPRVVWPAPNASRPNLIVSDQPFTNGSETAAGGTETGVLNGVPYRIHFVDGSGIFGGTRDSALHAMEPIGNNWQVGCKRDAISDQKLCHMYRRDLWVYVTSTGQTMVAVGHEHFPGSSVAVRIDGAAPFSASAAKEGYFSAAASSKIAQQLRVAKSLTTRYVKWPYKAPIDDSWEPYGFAEAFQYINWAVRRIAPK